MTIETDCDANAMTLLMLVRSSHLLFWFRFNIQVERVVMQHFWYHCIYFPH